MVATPPGAALEEPVVVETVFVETKGWNVAAASVVVSVAVVLESAAIDTAAFVVVAELARVFVAVVVL